MQRAPRCSTATLFLSVSLVDGYLALKEVKRDSLQLLVVAALFAAAKFVELTQQTCSKQDILTMEAKLLTAVEFRLCRPTAAHFADRYLQKHACEEVQGAVLAYLLQLALMEFSMLRYTPSEQVAAAALVSSRITGDQALQPCITRAAAPKREQRVVKCAVTLCRLLQAAPQSPWQAVRRKFIRSRNPEEKRRQLSLERRHRSDLEKEVESLRSQVALLMQRGPAPGLAAAAALAVGPKKLTRSALTSVASQAVQPDGAAAEVLQWKRLASKREQQLQREEREEQTGKITQVEYSNADALEGFQSNRRTRQALMRDHYGSFRLGGVADAS
eukprot:s1422_g2.t1